MNKIIIDMDNISDGSNAIIIKHKTGVFYTSQSGGLLCLHPEIEGYILSVLINYYHLDDCKYFCGLHSSQIGIDTIESFIKEFNKIETIYNLEVDLNCINQLLEGWIPVLVTYKDEFFYLELNKQPGILVLGNCD